MAVLFKEELGGKLVHSNMNNIFIYFERVDYSLTSRKDQSRNYDEEVYVS